MKTVSLEVAKQLKEEGFPQETDFYYWENTVLEKDHGLRHKSQIPKIRKDNRLVNTGVIKFYAALTADEILDLLPDHVRMNKLGYWLDIEREDKNTWNVFYEHNNRAVEIILEKEEKSYLKYIADGKGSLADAAAKAWLYLKKYDLLDQSE